MLGVHKVLVEMIPSIVTIIVPRHPQHGKEIAHVLFSTVLFTSIND